MPLSPDAIKAFVDQQWSSSIVDQLTAFIRIPNKSPAFDPDWAAHGHMAEAIRLVEGWCREHAPADATVEVVTLEGRTPVVWIDIPGTVDDCVILYGHLDKQPEMTGWAEDLGPWKPVLRDDKLYGRGGADDGYAAFASLTAINALRQQGVPHARCIILIEACEESGSYDLPHYIDHLAPRIGTPSLVVCLDAGCGNYDQMWCTTSLRGVATATLTVELLTEGVHSGDASGIVADSFRVMQLLLSRLEDPVSGRIVPAELHCEIPAQRIREAEAVGAALGSEVYDKFPLVPGAKPISDSPTELVLNRTWRPALSITGAAGLPPIADAGNVSRPGTSLKLSLRLPPTLPAGRALDCLESLFTHNVPYGARVTLADLEAAAGWQAPAMADWLLTATQEASETYFQAPSMFMGEGGSIPFMGLLGDKFPDAQFMITGVLGPHSNAHGPNEFLHLPTARRLTACVAHVVAKHAGR